MRIRIRVRPNSKEQRVEKIPRELFSEKGYEGLYLVKVKSPSEGGRANLEIVKLLTHYFGREARIRAGFTSRNKIIEVFE